MKKWHWFMLDMLMAAAWLGAALILEKIFGISSSFTPMIMGGGVGLTIGAVFVWELVTFDRQKSRRRQGTAEDEIEVPDRYLRSDRDDGT